MDGLRGAMFRVRSVEIGRTRSNCFLDTLKFEHFYQFVVTNLNSHQFALNWANFKFYFLVDII